MVKYGQNIQTYVKKSISNTEYEFKFDKNHNSKLPFSMIFVDLDTYLIDIDLKTWKFVHDPKIQSWRFSNGLKQERRTVLSVSTIVTPV